MDQFPPMGLAYIYDAPHKPRSRVELGAGLHAILASDPTLLPTLAVDMIVQVIDVIAVNDDDAKRLQWQVAEAMTAKMEGFKRMERTFNPPDLDEDPAP